MKEIEWHDQPVAERLGFAKMETGEQIKLSEKDSTTANQIAVHAYAAYHKKKFKTKTVDGHMHIKRIS